MTRNLVGTTALYRLFDQQGVLLYIGITVNPDARFKQHATAKPWWPDVDHSRTLLTWYNTRDEAGTAELAAIRDQNPQHNIVSSDESGCAQFLPRDGDRRWGRPATGQTPVRPIRLGPIWDRARRAAAEDGEKLAVFVERALTRELDRRARRLERDHRDLRSK
jgi:hypothetical protein